MPMVRAIDYPHIDSTDGFRGGRPRIVGTRFSVGDVVILHYHMGFSVEEIAGKFEIAPAAVHSALAYYHDHRDAIDRSLSEDAAFIDALRSDNASPLLGRLKSTGRG